ncbi:sarcocystatin-A [Musca domestica]|uniref:Sarcocystatin-A n=1 Tax=Musca domestica TaxID=7370 RepID=A0A1I8M9N6_MUSDO|nr:sarcocystatin-A [Musca domestica]
MNKLLALAIFALLCVVINARPNNGAAHVVGGAQKLDVEEAEETLNFSLKQLAKGDNGPNYKVRKIHSASKQLVSGILYKINADIIDGDEEKAKNCDIKIWAQPWLENGYKVTFNCEKEDELVLAHSA